MTEARRAQVRWPAIDRALARYSAVSLLPLLSAAIDSPLCRPWEPRLTALWARVMRSPPPGTTLARPVDLPQLITEAERALPPYPASPYLPAADPRDVVRFEVAGQRWRIHPGDHVYPLVTLRALAATAVAIDPVVYDLRGFTLTDVMDLVLAHADRVTGELAACWPPPRALDDVPSLAVTDAEAEVSSAILANDINTLAAGCGDPVRASRALTWLTRSAAGLSVRHSPHEPALGAVLAVDTGTRMVPVPAALTLGTLTAAAQILSREAARRPLARSRMDAITELRARALFTRRLPPRFSWPEGAPSTAGGAAKRGRHTAPMLEPEIFEGPHFKGAIVAGLTGRNLNHALDRADAHLTRPPAPAPEDPQPASGVTLFNLVAYGGPGQVRFHEVSDTLRIHIEELAEIFAGASGDEGIVAAFLSELTTHPGVDTVLVADVLDAWCWWHTQGYLVLPLPAEPGTALAIPDPPADPTWERAVAWEPAEQALTAAGLPGSAEWPVARLIENNTEADLLAPGDGMFAQVKLERPLAVVADFAEAEALGLNRGILFALADGIRITAGRHPDITEHLRLSHARPLTLRLRLRPERTPQEHDGIQVGFAVSPDTGVAEIVVGPDTVEGLQADGRDGHSIFGLVIYRAVERLRRERGEATEVDHERFMAAWNSCPPLIVFGFSESSAPTLATVDILPRGPHIRGRVIRLLAEQLRQRGVPAGTFHGDEARRVCREHLLPAMCDLLRSRIGQFGPMLADETLRRLSGAHAERHRRHTDITRALAGQFAANWIEDALQDQGGPALTRPLEVLLEFIVAYPPSGQESATLMDVAELADLAEYLLVTATHVRAADNGLYDLELTVLAGGVFTVEAQPAPTQPTPDLGFDGGAYMTACRRHTVAMALADDPPEPGPPATLPGGPAKPAPAPFTPLADIADPRLLQADTLLREALGTGFDAIRAVLIMARDWPAGEHGFARIDPAQLAEEAAEWSGLPPAEIQAAIESLALNGDDLRPVDGTRIAELETRGYRLGIRPLPVIGGKIAVVPWLAHAALGVYVAYIADRRFPYPQANLPPQAVHAMARHRQKHDRELERLVQAEVSAAGLPHRFRLTPPQAAAAGITGLPGEIDLVIADPNTSRLWVCEVKNPHLAFSARAIARHIQRFTTSDGYIDKLLAKARAIADNARSSAAACQVQADRPWRVIPLIVTPGVEPAAFVTEPRVTFTVSAELASLLQEPEDPPTGFVMNNDSPDL